jgi:hypothetical protein
MRQHTVYLPTSPREFYVWLDKWVVNVNDGWKPDATKRNAVYYQFMRPKYLDILNQPLPHTVIISRYKTVANLAPRIEVNWGGYKRPRANPPEKDWVAEALSQPAQVAIEMVVSLKDVGIEVEIHCNDLMGVRLEDFVMALDHLCVQPKEEVAVGSVLESPPLLMDPTAETTIETEPLAKTIPKKELLKCNQWLIDQYFNHRRTDYQEMSKEWLRIRKDEDGKERPDNAIRSMTTAISEENARRRKT